MKQGLLTTLVSVALSALVAVGIVKAATPTAKAGDKEIKTYTVDGSEYRTVNLSETDYPDFTYAAESSVDAVVFVKVTIRQKSMPIDDPFLRYFFGDQFGGGEQQGSGSGVIIRPDGYIVTFFFNDTATTEIEVTLNNNKTYEATVVGTDPATDIALIKIDESGLPVVPFGDSDELRLGEWVLAIGSPLGEQLRGTITAGIVSAKGRSMPNYSREFKIESFIQTDAAVNPGNSGGALVNKKGELVGINTAIVSQTGSYSGYSFAVPSNIVKKIVGDLIDFGSVKRARLGVSMSSITEKTAKELKLSSLEGVYINEVVKGGSADKAGMKEGDVLLKIDGNPVKTPSDLQAKVNGFHPGDKAVMTVVRDGQAKDLYVTFQGTEEVTGTVAEDGTVAFYGARLKAADAATLKALGLTKGVLVESAGNGKFASAGGSDGFVIRFVNDQEVSTPKEVVEAAKKARRAVYIEGVSATGRSGYFGFAKEE